MKAIIMERFGGPEVLQPAEVEVPEPGADEVLIKVAYDGVNPVDWKIREGFLKDMLPHEFPLIPGWDVAGAVAGVGSGVSDFETGAEVYAYCRKPVVQHGAYAEYVTMTAAAVAPKPANVALLEAAGIPLAGLTAWQSLFDHADLQEGQTVLIHAGAGGVGSHAIQFARHAGARVLTTASPANHDYVHGLGADVAIDYRSADFVKEARAECPDGVDVVFDLIGGEAQSHSYEALRPGGVLVSIVAPPDEDEAAKHDARGAWCFVEPNGGQLRQIAELLEANAVRPAQTESLPLAEAAAAQERNRDGHVRGKLVLRVG